MLHAGKYDRLKGLIDSGFTDWQSHGYVKTVEQGDLLLFNYTNEAQWAANWTWLETIGRGLIYDRAKREWAALPLPKFFNWGEGNRFDYTPVEYVTQKVDGWIGILYRDGNSVNQYKVASRGSFASDGAEVANSIITGHASAMAQHLPANVTLVFEIISPETRIVVDYGEARKLVVIAAYDRINMRELRYAELCKYAALCDFEVVKLHEDLQYVEQVEAHVAGLNSQDEGCVIRFESGNRFKFKSLEYLALHRLVSNFSAKVIVDLFFDGKTDDLLALPPHLRKPFDDVVNEVRAKTLAMYAEVDRLYAAADKTTQKDYALWVKANAPVAYHSMLFNKRNGFDVAELVKKRILEEI